MNYICPIHTYTPCRETIYFFFLPSEERNADTCALCKWIPLFFLHIAHFVCRKFYILCTLMVNWWLALSDQKLLAIPSYRSHDECGRQCMSLCLLNRKKKLSGALRCVCVGSCGVCNAIHSEIFMVIIYTMSGRTNGNIVGAKMNVLDCTRRAFAALKIIYFQFFFLMCAAHSRSSLDIHLIPLEWCNLQFRPS